MGEDADGGKSARSRFLSKSKWGKVFKENDAPPAAGKVNSFKLNEDVVDFLKPSTDKVASTRPKINIAVAQRWPEAHEVRRTTNDGQQKSAGTPVNGYRKPKRREGLVVAFVRTAPEIMGEGGDEAPDPPQEISRMKSMMARSVSARRAGSPSENPRQPRLPDLPAEDDFRPPPVRRAQTSHNEFSPPVQRKHASPPMENVVPHRPSLGRTPTGFSVEDSERRSSSDEEQRRPLPASAIRPSIKTSFEDDKELALHDSAMSTSRPPPAPSAGRLSPTPMSPALRLQRDMTANEGMALRRASALYLNEGEEEGDPSEGWKPRNDFYEALSQPMADKQLPEAPRSRSPHTRPTPVSAKVPKSSNPFIDPKYLKRRSRETSVPEVKTQPQRVAEEFQLSPESADSPQGPSPFADPKYIKRLSGEATASSASQPTPRKDAQLPFESLRQQRKQDVQPSYMKGTGGSTPPRQQSPSQEGSVPPTQVAGILSYMRMRTSSDATRPDAEQLEDRSSNTRAPASQPPSGLRQPGKPPPAPPAQLNTNFPNARERSPMRDKLYASPEQQRGIYSHPNQSGSANHFPTPSGVSHQRSRSREEQVSESAGSTAQPEPGQRYRGYSNSPRSNGPPSSLLEPASATRSAVSPSGRNISPQDYFSGPRNYQGQPAKSPVANLRNEEANRPGSASSNGSGNANSPQPHHAGDAAADLALADFAGRVAHMKGVFRLTAEKERPAESCTPEAWLRTAIWWYHKGKAGLEAMLQRMSRSREAPREMLLQPHVDLSKAWWIISEPLEQYDMSETGSPQSASSGANPQEVLQISVTLLRSYLKSLSASMQKSQLMPPNQSLIQGQDPTIWLQYPRFTADAAAVLGGSVGKSMLIETSASTTPPLEALPLGDTRHAFCYSRFAADVSVNTEEMNTDRIALPCILSMMRGRRDYQMTIVLASQNELVNIRIGPMHSNAKGLTWSDVSWRASSHSMIVHLPRSFDLTIRMQERDFRSLWNLAEYSRKVEHSLRTEPGEKLVHEARLNELQYADSAGTSSFPAEKVKTCTALIFERIVEHRDGSGVRKMHRGYRLLLVTDPGHKSLSCASHELCRLSPFLFEFITDAAAAGTTAMVVRVREESRKCRILLVFPDAASRQAMYDVLNGLTIGPDETIVGKMVLTGVKIEAASQTEGFTPISHPALQGLQWQRLGVTNMYSNDHNPPTVESENLRIVARHTAGCITDRLNLGKGELLIRLPCADKAIPTIQMLRQPQEDLTMSIDTRQAPQAVTDGIAELLRLAQDNPTIRTFTFATPADLHSFQAAITGFQVTYDGIASTFGISRRMMVVPIHHKWTASNVRLQVVTQGNTTQVLVFMEDFSHADAMCFQVKTMDTFESVKGDAKGKKWAVKMKDAKFSLPRQEKEAEMQKEERGRRRFVNLEGLEYAEEHDDITIGFEREEGELSMSPVGHVWLWLWIWMLTIND
jgi:hypothetical protein